MPTFIQKNTLRIDSALSEWRICAWVFLAVLLLIPASASARQPQATPSSTLVERVSFARSLQNGGLVVRIHVSEKLGAHSLPVADGNGTLSIRLFRTELSKKRILDNPILPIQSYDINESGQDVVIRLTLDQPGLAANAYRDESSNDLLISIAQSGSGNFAIPTSEPVSGERWTLDTIVIDAGHGGKDSGAVGPGGLKEKNVVLDVALKVGEYIKDKLGLNVIYTRDSDEFISLQGRGHLANKAGAKLFISIHANSAPNRSATGTETYFLGLHKSDAAKRVMERENEVIQFEDDQSQYEQIDARLAVMQTLAQSAYMRQSQFLADLVENQFVDRVGRKSRGVKQAGFYVLYGASMPSILVELGFISNPGEASFMASEDGQDYLASAIYRAVVAYKSEYDKGLFLSTNGGK